MKECTNEKAITDNDCDRSYICDDCPDYKEPSPSPQMMICPNYRDCDSNTCDGKKARKRVFDCDLNHCPETGLVITCIPYVEPSPAKDIHLVKKTCKKCYKTYGTMIDSSENFSWELCPECKATKPSPEPMPLIEQIAKLVNELPMARTMFNEHLKDILKEEIAKLLKDHDQQVRKAATAEFAEKCIKNMPMMSSNDKRVSQLIQGASEMRTLIIAHLRAMAEKE